MSYDIRQGDVLERLREMPDVSVQCVVTSPPYWGLRDYGTGSWEGGDPAHDHDTVKARGGRGGSGTNAMEVAQPDEVAADVCSCGARHMDRQLGLEKTPAEYVERMVAVFEEVRRVLREDGTCWVNIGDTYVATNGKGYRRDRAEVVPVKRPLAGLKPKDLCLIPERLAIALQDAGWWVRSRIAWVKGSAMPESVRDRPTSAWEHIFLLTKNARYYYDSEAVRQNSKEVQYMPADTSSFGFLPEEGPRQSSGEAVQAVQRSKRAEAQKDGALPRAKKAVSGVPGLQGRTGPLSCNREGSGGTGAEESEPAASEKTDSTNADRGRMGAGAGEVEEQMRVLQGGRAEVDAGSCNSDQQGGRAYEGKRGAGMSAMQQQKEGQARSSGSNLRNWWLINSENFPEAHFATFPSEIPRRCILMGTSAKGCCPECGAPWERVVERTGTYQGQPGRTYRESAVTGRNDAEIHGGRAGDGRPQSTTGWHPTCSCVTTWNDDHEPRPYQPRPCTVLDPFAGSGTTLMVAEQLGRDSIGIELSPEYCEMAERRIQAGLSVCDRANNEPEQFALELN